uniref:Uncharacterized protein n=1 Tax=Trichuris muris TaxID=70415 RepID=A0A5S6QAZ5_TRIMR
MHRLLEAITDRLSSNGHIVLPSSDACQQTAILALAKQDLSDNEIIDIVSSNVEILRISNEEINSALNLFALFGVSPASAVRLILAGGRSLKVEDVQSLLNHLLAQGISTKYFEKMLEKCSDLLKLTPTQVDEKFAVLLDFFSHKQCLFTVSHYPDVLLRQAGDLRSKYEFLHLNIGLSSAQVSQSRWFAHPLSKLQLRFECACRCGVYEIPDVRQERQSRLVKHNPKLPWKNTESSVKCTLVKWNAEKHKTLVYLTQASSSQNSLDLRLNALLLHFRCCHLSVILLRFVYLGAGAMHHKSKTAS